MIYTFDMNTTFITTTTTGNKMNNIKQHIIGTGIVVVGTSSVFVVLSAVFNICGV